MRNSDGQLLKDAVLQERYQVLEMVTKGPGSRTYKCWDQRREKNIFVKELITSFTDPSLRQQAIEQFKFEAKILFKLKHENLPKFEDYFDFDGNRYLTFNFLEGERLNQIVDNSQGFLSEKQILGWAIELCDVLAYLHNTKPNPVIFRDLSPESTLLATDGKLRLIDFGIAKIYDSDAKTMGIAKTMTAHYSPIEQHAGTTDERSDIYSLGATLYYLSAKEPPMDCVERIIDDEPMDPPSKYNPNMSPELERVILKAMEVDKKDRYQKVEEMRADIENITPAEIPGATFAGMDDDDLPPEEVSEDDHYKPISFETPQHSSSGYQQVQASHQGNRAVSITPDYTAPSPKNVQQAGSPSSTPSYSSSSPGLRKTPSRPSFPSSPSRPSSSYPPSRQKSGIDRRDRQQGQSGYGSSQSTEFQTHQLGEAPEQLDERARAQSSRRHFLEDRKSYSPRRPSEQTTPPRRPPVRPSVSSGSPPRRPGNEVSPVSHTERQEPVRETVPPPVQTGIQRVTIFYLIMMTMREHWNVLIKLLKLTLTILTLYGERPLH